MYSGSFSMITAYFTEPGMIFSYLKIQFPVSLIQNLKNLCQ